MQILSSDEKGLSSQQDRQVISKFFQFWAVSLHLDTVPAFYTVLWEKVLIFFTLAFPTNPTTSELIHLLLQMEVGFQAWCFTEKKKSFGTLLWPGTHSTVTEDKNFSSKKKRWKIIFFFDTLYLRSFSSRTWLTLLSIHIVWSLFWISCYAQEVFTLSFVNSSKN